MRHRCVFVQQNKCQFSFQLVCSVAFVCFVDEHCFVHRTFIPRDSLHQLNQQRKRNFKESQNQAKMNKLKLITASESSKHIGNLIMTLLEEKNPEERVIIENRLVNALREPVTSMSIKLDRLFVFIQETCENMDATKFSELVARIRGLCFAMSAPNDGRNNNNDSNGLSYYVSEPKCCGINRKIGKRVRILIGLNIGKVGEVVEMKFPTVTVRMASGKIVKYLPKYLEFLDSPGDESDE